MKLTRYDYPDDWKTLIRFVRLEMDETDYIGRA